jgi:hypothetical protein
MASVIRLQMWGSPLDTFNFYAIIDAASHRGLFRPLISFVGDLKGFFGAELTLVASMK